jgi:hypothetical protein
LRTQPGQKEQDITALLKNHRQALQVLLWQQAEVEERLEQIRQRQQALNIELGHLWQRKEHFKLLRLGWRQLRHHPVQLADNMLDEV